MILDEYGAEDRSNFSLLGLFRFGKFGPRNVFTIGILRRSCCRLRSSDSLHYASFRGSFHACRLNQLQQCIKVCCLGKPVVIHRMAAILPALTQLRSVFGETPKYAPASEIRR
jgi:hypothetical protein